MELGTEKSATQKLESGKLVLERQNKELKAKLAELETAARTKTKVCLHYSYFWFHCDVVQIWTFGEKFSFCREPKVTPSGALISFTRNF